MRRRCSSNITMIGDGDDTQRRSSWAMRRAGGQVGGRRHVPFYARAGVALVLYRCSGVGACPLRWCQSRARAGGVVVVRRAPAPRGRSVVRTGRSWVVFDAALPSALDNCTATADQREATAAIAIE